MFEGFPDNSLISECEEQSLPQPEPPKWYEWLIAGLGLFGFWVAFFRLAFYDF